ncbi:MazG nucleotide pyrophosphohydrolase [Neobacillus bataviensis LMG 21833]|uniref:MazG nucleotide pyrophosphohydrolase n=1 Tax=Neobacillus bataviensis LMG 21833 TaxID=1117379 RepID=K6E7J0_9BACI|nr:nucleotide pyrophosphohydrolase [Neobacillus bataviensis]EKN69276.1 MazG nucleotide pyrophosphohydrolase [Neobacillus bataviensis LMG 21833]
MLDHIIAKIIEFRNERDWKQYHNPKDLAISISLEASELLENFQWRGSEEAVSEKIGNIKDELADVLIYSLLLANELDLDIQQIVESKIEKNKVKYPVEKAYGNKTKYTEL